MAVGRPLVLLHDVRLEYPRPHEGLKKAVSRMLRGPASRGSAGGILALDGLTLSIESGDRVGLIGRNGAGKSTLLRLLGGIYHPTSGIRRASCEVRCLNELSLGFEPDASGRENAAFRALLLGATRSQVPEIVADAIAFAELGSFIDEPIRCYSAGMLVRLAFAVTTAFPGELLLLDEVVGAGDAHFTGKAKARMMALAEKASAFVLATHDVAMIRSFCNRALLLEHGRLVFDGSVEQAVDRYMGGSA